MENLNFLFLEKNANLFPKVVDLLCTEWDMNHLKEIEEPTFDDESIQTLLMVNSSQNLMAHCNIEKGITCEIAEISYVIVQEEKRKKGLGKILMDKAHQVCKEKGYEKVEIKCKDSRIGFYEKCGYKVMKKLEEYEDGEKLNLMEFEI